MSKFFESLARCISQEVIRQVLVSNQTIGDEFDQVKIKSREFDSGIQYSV